MQDGSNSDNRHAQTGWQLWKHFKIRRSALEKQKHVSGWSLLEWIQKWSRCQQDLVVGHCRLGHSSARVFGFLAERKTPVRAGNMPNLVRSPSRRSALERTKKQEVIVRKKARRIKRRQHGNQIALSEAPQNLKRSILEKKTIKKKDQLRKKCKNIWLRLDAFFNLVFRSGRKITTKDVIVGQGKKRI